MGKITYKDLFSQTTENQLIDLLKRLYGCTISLAGDTNLVIHRVENKPDICKYIDSHPECQKYCQVMKETLAEKLKETGNVIVSNCPFGFANMIIPLRLFGEIIGAVYLCGQFRESQHQDKVENIIEKFGLDKDEYVKYLDKAKYIEDKDLFKAKDLLLSHCDSFISLLYNNYILSQINKREMLLREITTSLLEAESFNAAITPIMKKLSTMFGINRVVTIDIVNEQYINKNDFIKGDRVMLESFAKTQYKTLFDELRKLMLEEDTNIITLNSERILNSKRGIGFINEYWKRANISSITALYHHYKDTQRLIIFVLYNNEKEWAEDELSFLTLVSEQICLGLKMRDLDASSRNEVSV